MCNIFFKLFNTNLAKIENFACKKAQYIFLATFWLKVAKKASEIHFTYWLQTQLFDLLLITLIFFYPLKLPCP